MTKQKTNVLGTVGQFFRECKSEIKKIMWPTPKATFRNMGVVLVMILLIGLYVFGLDTGSLKLLGTFMNVSG